MFGTSPPPSNNGNPYIISSPASANPPTMTNNNGSVGGGNVNIINGISNSGVGGGAEFMTASNNSARATTSGAAVGHQTTSNNIITSSFSPAAASVNINNIATTIASGNNNNNNFKNNFVAKDADRLLQEMIDQETSRYLSKDQLFELARERGASIPLWISSSLFKYALGVITIDKSQEMSLLKAQEEEYTALHKARKASGEGVHVGVWKALRKYGGGGGVVNGGGGRPQSSASSYQSRHQFSLQALLLQEFGHPSDPNRKRIENVLDAIEISFPEISLQMAKTILKFLVPMAAVNSNERESDVFFCLKNFIGRLRSEGQILHSSSSLLHIVSQFMCHFHTFTPMLYKHFFLHEIDVFDWVPDLLTSLFVDHLPQHQLLVLWSYYLMDGLQYHPFVLLAILEESADDLIELDGEGILDFLKSKPFPMRARGGRSGVNSNGSPPSTSSSPYPSSPSGASHIRCGADAKSLFARAKVLHGLANRKEKLV